jgi:hypothetical protein
MAPFGHRLTKRTTQTLGVEASQRICSTAGRKGDNGAEWSAWPSGLLCRDVTRPDCAGKQHSGDERHKSAAERYHGSPSSLVS